MSGDDVVTIGGGSGGAYRSRPGVTAVVGLQRTHTHEQMAKKKMSSTHYEIPMNNIIIL